MPNKGLLTKILALVGTLVVLFPILAPLAFSAGSYAGDRILRFDFLMPAELFPAAFIGAGLLFWAAMRAHSREKLIGWWFAAAAGLLIGAQQLAVVTGLDSGEGPPEGIWWITVIVMINAYSLALVITGIYGVLLLRELFRPSPVS